MQEHGTRWTVIRGAAEGSTRDREAFARLYLPLARNYLAARWRQSPLQQEIDDAVQEVFVDCFKDDGALERADPGLSFRSFFYGVIRMVALRHEDRRRRRRRERQPETAFDNEADEPSLAAVFDRAWAQSLMEQAAARQRERAERSTEDARRRVELLRLRFEEDLPIRQIAALWGLEAAFVHREYAKARREFHEALRDVVALYHAGAPVQIDAECQRLIGFLE